MATQGIGCFSIQAILIPKGANSYPHKVVPAMEPQASHLLNPGDSIVVNKRVGSWARDVLCLCNGCPGYPLFGQEADASHAMLGESPSPCTQPRYFLCIDF